MSKNVKNNEIDRAKISLPLDTSEWIRDLQSKHRKIRGMHLSLSQIVSRGMDLARSDLTMQLTQK